MPSKVENFSCALASAPHQIKKVQQNLWLFASGAEIAETFRLMSFDLKEIVAARLGENYQLHERHVNRTLVAAQCVIGFDKVYARAEGAYLYDMDNQPSA